VSSGSHNATSEWSICRAKAYNEAADDALAAGGPGGAGGRRHSPPLPSACNSRVLPSTPSGEMLGRATWPVRPSLAAPRLASRRVAVSATPAHTPQVRVARLGEQKGLPCSLSMLAHLPASLLSLARLSDARSRRHARRRRPAPRRQPLKPHRLHLRPSSQSCPPLALPRRRPPRSPRLRRKRRCAPAPPTAVLRGACEHSSASASALAG